MTSPYARVEGGVVHGLELEEFDAADALAAVARASGGACALRFGTLVAAPGAEDPLRAWIDARFKNALAFDARAFRSAAEAAGMPEAGAPSRGQFGAFAIVAEGGETTGIDVHIVHPEPRSVRVRWGSVETGDADMRLEDATARAPLAVAFEATRTLSESGDVQRAMDATKDGEAASRAVARLMSASRRAVVQDAVRGALRMEFESAVPDVVRNMWPLDVPARRIREQAPCHFFEHARLDVAALCFEEACEAGPSDDEEWVLVCFEGGDAFGIGKASGRARMNRRARALCRLEARVVAQPSLVRGAFFWKRCTDAVKDVNIFARTTDSAENDVRCARAAVDAVGFNRAAVAVWINADEARQELADISNAA